MFALYQEAFDMFYEITNNEGFRHLLKKGDVVYIETMYERGTLAKVRSVYDGTNAVVPSTALSNIGPFNDFHYGQLIELVDDSRLSCLNKRQTGTILNRHGLGEVYTVEWDEPAPYKSVIAGYRLKLIEEPVVEEKKFVHPLDAICRAWLDGKPIEFRCALNGVVRWKSMTDCTQIPYIDFHPWIEYRIKPTSVQKWIWVTNGPNGYGLTDLLSEEEASNVSGVMFKIVESETTVEEPV